jgi:type VI secretion system secreted protein Hcp
MTKPSGGAEFQYYTITLENATISSVDTSIDATGDSEELVGFAYEKIKITYREQGGGKASGGEHEIEYDVAAGQ